MHLCLSLAGYTTQIHIVFYSTVQHNMLLIEVFCSLIMIREVFFWACKQGVWFSLCSLKCSIVVAKR